MMAIGPRPVADFAARIFGIPNPGLRERAPLSRPFCFLRSAWPTRREGT